METENPETDKLLQLAEKGGVEKKSGDGKEIEMRIDLWKNGF
mgnify:CR=1 FL=1|jgi:hypothetical protein